MIRHIVFYKKYFRSDKHLMSAGKLEVLLMKRMILITALALTVVLSAGCGRAKVEASKIGTETEKATESVANSGTEATTENNHVNETSKLSDTKATSNAESTSTKENSKENKEKADKKSATASDNGSAASNAVSSNQYKPASAAGSKGTDSSAGTANEPAAHTHKWVKYLANTIQHKEEGHYETKVVKAAYDEPQYDWHNVCNKCGKDLGTDDWNVINHGDICDGSYSCIQVQVGTIHHDAETTQVWVVDKPAYTEYVYGEKCSGCDATK